MASVVAAPLLLFLFRLSSTGIGNFGGTGIGNFGSTGIGSFGGMERGRKINELEKGLLVMGITYLFH